MAQSIPGPYETERQARDDCRDIYHLMRHGAVGASTAELRRRLLNACEDAGVDLGEYDRRILEWLTGWEPETVQVLVGIIRRAGGAR